MGERGARARLGRTNSEIRGLWYTQVDIACMTHVENALNDQNKPRRVEVP